MDLYVGKYYGEVEVFINSNEIFTSADDLQANGVNINVGYKATPSFADIDNDGDLDLYVGDPRGSVKVFTNTGGVFSTATNLQAAGKDIEAGGYSNPTFADVDGDGDLDLYVGNRAGEISFYENTTFTAVLVSSISVQGAGNATTITTAGGTLQMGATVLPANAADDTYSWSVANGTGSATIDANGLLTALTDGTVTVTATANDASGETATMVVTISSQTLGLNELSLNKVNIYPNPVQNELFVEVKNEKITKIDIIDFSGKVIKSIANSTTKSIDVSELKQGIYVLKVSTETGVSTNRFIKQ